MTFTLVSTADGPLALGPQATFGLTREDFLDRAPVLETTPTRFSHGPVAGVTFPRLVYSGVELVYADITLEGHVMATPNAGVLTGVRLAFGGGALELTFTLAAAEFFRVARTPSDADNRALLDVMLAGDDRFELAGRGRDVVSGRSGDDVMFLGRGNDVGRGDAGNDRLHGGPGDDRLHGGTGADLLEGGKGDDRLWGGAGPDSFVFIDARLGRDVIEDFEPGRDVLAISVRGLDDMSDIAMPRVGEDTVLRFGGTVVTLEDVLPRQLSARDFDFA